MEQESAEWAKAECGRAPTAGRRGKPRLYPRLRPEFSQKKGAPVGARLALVRSNR
jgi:hypothetical protein